MQARFRTVAFVLFDWYAHLELFPVEVWFLTYWIQAFSFSPVPFTGTFEVTHAPHGGLQAITENYCSRTASGIWLYLGECKWSLLSWNSHSEKAQKIFDVSIYFNLVLNLSKVQWHGWKFFPAKTVESMIVPMSKSALLSWEMASFQTVRQK